jgi:monovalent cation:H+ antiporter-2, CPA2 family
VHGAHAFLPALSTVLCVAAVTTVLFQRLHQPVVLGYLLAGLLVGPHVPIPLVADPEIVQTLSELGVILLMFSLGLEFSLRKLLQVGPRAALTAVVESSVMVWLGYLAGRAFGWSRVGSLFAGATVAISSTTIVARAFDEQRVSGAARDRVLGVLVVEDLVAILLMTLLTAVAGGDRVSPLLLATSAGRLALFLVLLVAIGLLVVPRAVRAIVKTGKPETLLVASVGLCFAVALLAQEAGYSVALGAFLAGSLVSESGEAHAIEPLVAPVRDLFAAVFFVSVGMLIDPLLIAHHWRLVLALSGLVLAGKTLGVGLGAFLTGSSPRQALAAGMSLSQIGEFSFILAGLGLALKAAPAELYPAAVAVSAFTTLTTPWMIRLSGPAAALVDRKLPHRLQTFAALYGSWVDALAEAPVQRTAGARHDARRLLRDLALLAGVLIGTSLGHGALAGFFAEHLSLPLLACEVAVFACAAAVAAPLGAGVVLLSRGLGRKLALSALPESGRMVDLAQTPRRALLVTLQLTLLLACGLLLLAVTQPFLPGWVSLLLPLLALPVSAVVFWRTATNLDGHVRAGAEVIADALLSQSRATPHGRVELGEVDRLLPGMGAPTAVRIEAGDPAAGRSLKELNLRGATGATVLAIARGEERVVAPGPDERLRAGDVLALAGTHEAVAAASALLSGQR